MDKKPVCAVLTRLLPIDGKTDTLIKICEEQDTVVDVMSWADKKCEGDATMLSLDIVQAE